METDYIKDVLEVAKYKSFNKASEVMNISTPAIRKRITAIENELNQKIFVRNSKGAFLTKEGRLILEKLKLVYEKIESIKVSESNLNGNTIRLGILPSFYPINIKEIQNSDCYNFQILINDNTISLIDALKDKKIDVAIGDITNLRIDDFYTEELYDEDYFVIYSKERGELNNSDINISAEQIYVQTPPCDTLRFIKSNFKNTREHLVYNNYFETILANVATNKGITLLPYSYLDKINLKLNYTRLENHVRKVGLISSSKSLNSRVYDILNNLTKTTPSSKYMN